ncbi:FAD-binding oxidoreductase [Moheibacter sp.]|uniref:FAD-binding oxidoreductase n=1 Tax=Moheibacter sp. TaxID=1965316 RepID=UPI003C73E054
MEYKVLTDDDLNFFRKTIGENNVMISELEKYASDSTEKLEFFPEVVLKPDSAEKVSKIVAYCYRELLPITPRGAGTGLTGGSLAVKGGVLISLEKLNQLIEIDQDNFQVKVDAGVINYKLQEALAEKNLFYPPDPSSWQSSFIGGNISTNAGGIKAVKYGVTSHYVLNLEVVLPNGEIIWTGANTLKNSTGLNLTQLFTGSEGTLGIITKAVLKVLPKPTHEVSLLVPFRNASEACEAVAAIFHAGLHPAAVEFMEKRAIDATVDFLGESMIPIEEDTEAHLLISLDENIDTELQKCVETLSKFNIGEILFAENQAEKDRVWHIRRKVSEVVKRNGYTIEEDTVVPRGNLAKLVNEMHKLADRNNFKVVCYGHAGDGNLHVRINHPDFKNSYNVPDIQVILKELFTIVKELGGTISGEHGIGLIQKNFLPIVFSEANLELQKSIKKTIDPRNIMNPGKIFLST